ncbi:putative ABC transporter permease [Pseudoflavonifractor sp. An85]|uniref:putative ABC transporter permease n=1 Tax=Pseudoflavonifractor sp. An85 TaxID=1965661 RepID=UPI001302D330|nr:putative ABC transporter permease [Pseudoflavonifractor sp. An85]
MQELIWYILVYSFLGYLLEVAYSKVVHGHGRGRKCLLLLPLCPVYGVGAVAIVALSGPDPQPLWGMTVGCLVATATEFLFGLYYKYVLGVSFWDYSQVGGNVGGLVCLPFSLAWSGLALVLLYTVHPFVKTCVLAIPPQLSTPAWIVFLADCLVSSFALKREGNALVLQWYR